MKAYFGGALDAVDQVTEVLIVDDNMFNLTSLQTIIFIKFGLNSSICSSGKLALQFIDERIKHLVEKNNDSMKEFNES